MNAMPPIAEMERAYQQRDTSYIGTFFLGVRTTGIFCRPGCPARAPLPKNVEYFPNAQAALWAGYRPCKRCKPLEWDDSPAWAAGLIADIEADPARRITAADLRKRGVDPATARRHFLRKYGMSFHAFARARRLGTTFNQLRKGTPIDTAITASGYDSPSGFRAAFGKAFGSPPGAARDGECVLLAWIASPLGPLVAGATSEGICLLEFTDRRMIETQLKTLGRLFKAALVPGSNAHLEQLKIELEAYFAGRLKDFTVKLSFPGSPFQKRVWDELSKIPHGETRSYEALAVAVGCPKGARAVGRANGLNRIGIVIPCHRVVNKDGSLGGYGGGLHRKRFLLELEGAGKAVKAGMRSVE